MKHKGCPSCGGKGDYLGSGCGTSFVYCMDCGMKTGLFDTEEKAWAAWDRRAVEPTHEASRLERTVMDLAKGVTSAGYWKLPAENAAGEILDLAKALIAAIDEAEK